MKRTCIANHCRVIPAVLILLSAAEVNAESVTVEMHKVSPEGTGESVGTLTMTDSPKGLTIKADLSRLPSGPHGFHVHEKGVCVPGGTDGKAAAAAGPHYARPGQDKHAGPEGTGHIGDLPFLTVRENGTANQTLTAPRLKLEDVRGRSLIIHEGGDNYSDIPESLGGGGARIACGVVEQGPAG